MKSVYNMHYQECSTTLGSATIGDDFKEALENAGEKTADAFEKLVEDRIGEFGREKLVLSEFRTQLQAFASSFPKSTIVIIDELDRCRPDFAVNLLERVKHFFDVENVVFVLLINKKQFSNAIRGVYGAETDARAYLEKFLNFTFTFPVSPHRLNNEANFIRAEFDQYSIEETGSSAAFKNSFGSLACSFKMSPRQVQRAIALFALASPIPDDGDLLAYLSVVKVCMPDIYDRMAAGALNAHQELLEEARAKNRVLVENGSGEDNILSFVESFHSLWADPAGEKVKKFWGSMDTSRRNINRMLASLTAQLNVSVS
jgi:hypothetical protein